MNEICKGMVGLGHFLQSMTDLGTSLTAAGHICQGMLDFSWKTQLGFLTMAGAWGAYYYVQVNEKPEIYHHPDNHDCRELFLNESYLPPIILFNPYAQISWHIVTESVKYVRRKFSCPMHKKLLVDFGQHGYDLIQKNLPGNAPIIVLLYGIMGDREQFDFFIRMATEHNFRTIVIHRRGHPPYTKTAGPVYNNIFGHSPDLVQSIEDVTQRYPDAPLFLLGESMGCEFLLRYLARTENKVQAAVAISSGFNTLEHLDSSNWLIKKAMLCRIKRHFLSNPEMRSINPVYYDKCMKVNSVRRLINYIYPFAGSNSFLQYFRSIKLSDDEMLNIKTPMLFLSALDDPVCSKDCIRYDLIEKNPYWTLLLTKRGGHCNFYSWDSGAWSSHKALTFFSDIIFRNESTTPVPTDPPSGPDLGKMQD